MIYILDDGRETRNIVVETKSVVTTAFILIGDSEGNLMSGTESSAAADGVGALRSETKSQIVKSVSCPTADIIGT